MATKTRDTLTKPVEPTTRAKPDETQSQDFLRDSSLLNLQRRAGNRAVVQLIASHRNLQTKLRTDQPGDEYEHEADTAALEAPRLMAAPVGVVQRKCATCTPSSKCAECE